MIDLTYGNNGFVVCLKMRVEIKHHTVCNSIILVTAFYIHSGTQNFKCDFLFVFIFERFFDKLIITDTTTYKYKSVKKT